MKEKCCKTCYWSYEDSEWACGAVKSSWTAWNLPCNAEKFCCYRWESFIFKKHYCCDVEIAYTKEIEPHAIDFYIRLYKQVHGRDLTIKEATDEAIKDRHDDNIEMIVRICADRKSQYKKDLDKLNDKYGNRVIRKINYEEILLKKAIAEKEEIWQK